jgi:cystathionine beta-synthase
MFNDYWMLDQGFQDRKTFGDLRDLISRRHQRKEDHTLSHAMPLIQAIKTMRLYDISQLAVLDEHGAVAGIIDESDILLAVTSNAKNFRKPCSEFMTCELDTLSASAQIDELVPLFAQDKVAIVLDDDGEFLGLITKIDLINHLRRQLPR